MVQARVAQRTVDGKKGITNWLGLIFHQTTSVQKTWTGPGILIYSSRQRIHGRHPPLLLSHRTTTIVESRSSLTAHSPTVVGAPRRVQYHTVPRQHAHAHTQTSAHVCVRTCGTTQRRRPRDGHRTVCPATFTSAWIPYPPHHVPLTTHRTSHVARQSRDDGNVVVHSTIPAVPRYVLKDASTGPGAYSRAQSARF
jgi:hypothetical protein